MKCPICKTKILIKKELDLGLLSFNCENCDGTWIRSSQYWNWRNQQGQNLSEISVEESINLKVDDSRGVKFCPDCSKFMFGFKVGHGTHFSLDRCNTCGGMWLDKNEWEALKSRNLHDEIHFIFSAPWQSKVKKEELTIRVENLLKDRLGEEDYFKVKEITEWIQKHENKSEIAAYIKESIK